MACVLAGGGCFIMPKTETSRQLVSTEQVDVGPPASQPMRVEATSTGGQIQVRATAPRTCKSITWQSFEIKQEKTATLEVVDTGPGTNLDAILWLVAAPITLAASGLITAIVLVASDDKTTRERRKTFTSYRDCSIAGANLPVTVTLPSGVGVGLVTSDDGRAYFDMPDGEPDDGDVMVTVGALTPHRVHYCRTCVEAGVPPTVAPETRETCLELRSKRMLAAQRIADVKERTRLLLALPDCSK